MKAVLTVLILLIAGLPPACPQTPSFRGVGQMPGAMHGAGIRSVLRQWLTGRQQPASAFAGRSGSRALQS